jgi:hemerythrin
MVYTWDKELETGHVVVDNQHKQLVMTVNDLRAAIALGKGAEEIEGIMSFLRAYVVRHFQDEEDLQLRYGYENYYEHVAHHREFKTRINMLAGRLRDEGPLPELVEEIAQCASDWLVNHIKGDDFKMAAYVRTCKEKEQARERERAASDREGTGETIREGDSL